MRILCIETRYGVKTGEGKVPILYNVVERWDSLEAAVREAEEKLRQTGLTWTTRRLSPGLVELDANDAEDTLIGLWDADEVEQKTGVSIDDFCQFYLTRQDFFEKLAIGAHPGLADRLKAIGAKLREEQLDEHEWSSDYPAAERLIRESGTFRGVVVQEQDRARRVKVWNALIGFKGDPRPAAIWDGPDGPIQFDRIGLGRGGGDGIQQLPRGTIFISWRMLRRLIESGHQYVIGGRIIDAE